MPYFETLFSHLLSNGCMLHYAFLWDLQFISKSKTIYYNHHIQTLMSRHRSSTVIYYICLTLKPFFHRCCPMVLCYTLHSYQIWNLLPKTKLFPTTITFKLECQNRVPQTCCFRATSLWTCFNMIPRQMYANYSISISQIWYHKYALIWNPFSLVLNKGHILYYDL